MRDVRMDGAEAATTPIGRRAVLRGAMATAGVLGLGAGLGTIVPRQVAAQRGAGGSNGAQADSTLALARFLNNTAYRDLPPKAIEHAKMILASTFASAAAGSVIDSARILRQLAKEQGGKPEATIWFDGTKLPVSEAARVNAILSDAAASDDSDIRNTAHEGTTLAAVGLAIAERTGATGQDLLGAMILGYEAAGRIGEARSGGRGGVHASQIVAFAGATAAAKLLKLTDEQMAHALGIVAITMGGLATGTNTWAREYMGANAAACGVNAALAASRGYTVNEDMLGSRGGFVDVFGGGAKAVERLTADLGKEWDIVDFLAIKLWPGAHPFSGTVEAAMNAARAGERRSRRRREDPRGRSEPDDHSGEPAARQPGRRHSQPVVLRRVGRRGQGLHLGTRDRGEVLRSEDHQAHGSGGRRSGAASGEVHLELGGHGHDRHHVRDAVHEHGGRATGIRTARHRVERCRSQVPRPDAGVEAGRAAHRRRPRLDSRFRAREERVGVDSSARAGTLIVKP